MMIVLLLLHRLVVAVGCWTCLLVVVVVPRCVVVASKIPCWSTDDCAKTLYEGSQCVDGLCTNPFHSNGGCLKTLLPDSWHKIRVCGSGDPPDAADRVYCRPPPIDYTEIRILAQNWESSYFETWILQILFSEILGVPTSVETGSPHLNMDFYDIDSSLSHDGDYDVFYKELEVAYEVTDCRKIRNTENPQHYRSCAHIAPEIWYGGIIEESVIDKPGLGPLRELGAVGEQFWFIPRFTAERDPSLSLFLGLGGQNNRRKVAETFKFPATWKQYCDEVSTTKCATSDDGNIAVRPPADETEENSFFVDGLYTGHFRDTDANDCERYPTNCTGHIADYPCVWTSFTRQQAYHLDIPLESRGPQNNGGYTYTQLTQIWAAANATKSDVMMMWWRPESLYQQYIGTDAEFTKVQLPPPTQQCADARIDLDVACTGDYDDQIGDPAGACDQSASPLMKLVGESLRRDRDDPGVPDALRSPSFEAAVNFGMSNIQLDAIFKLWYEMGRDKLNFDPRDATCRWVVDNMDTLMSFVPDTYPRIVQEVDVSENPVFVAAIVVAGLSIVVVVAAVVMTFKRRNDKTMYHLQIVYAVLLLMGLLLISAGALIYAFPPSDTTCAAGVWLLNVGFGLHLIPLFVRITAISRLNGTGKLMQRVRLSKTRLLRTTAIGTLLICGFLTAWMLVDIPTKEYHYELTTRRVTETGETIVTVHGFCGSQSDGWYLASFAWQGVLLFLSTIISFLASLVREDLNDTKSMAMVLVEHLFFWTVRVTIFLRVDGAESSISMGFLSLALSADVIGAVGIYFVPKFARNRDKSTTMDPGDKTMILPDLFLHATVMMADVVGFSAWSSVREPVQVFKFLEELNEAFDNLAEKRRVYRVETVRDSFVAATGIPKEQHDHVVLMARFASDCVKAMGYLSQNMETSFGPDTGDLALRAGIHTGPVTGGLLKAGKGANRFQLFGGTVTTARVVQTTGRPGAVHLSKEAAELLMAFGKKHWVRPRDDAVRSTEKGVLQTYWLTRGGRHGQEQFDQLSFCNASSVGGDSDLDDHLHPTAPVADGELRWIEWNVEVLHGLLKQIVARRQRCFVVNNNNGAESTGRFGVGARMPLEEVKEIITLPEFDRRAAKRQIENLDKVRLPQEVLSQLHLFVSECAKLYRPNPFHNFAHASYVVMAVTKYLSRIMAASEIDLGFDEDKQRSSTLALVNDHTYGVSSHPLTQFACVFSALIHDIDHPGVPNPQLIKENATLSACYDERSVAEQRSLDLAWNLFMRDEFRSLRGAICCDETELGRLRQLVVNSVMATDLGDKELKELRNNRWGKAFRNDDGSLGPEVEDVRTTVNRKATVVIEHLIQMADVAHTCSHFEIYLKWNARLFEECYAAWRSGRAETSPAEGWYKGELGFFDFYIIPLAKKLRDCGVFGPTSDENLNYARNNRARWEAEGEKIVECYLRKMRETYPDDGDVLGDDEDEEARSNNNKGEEERVVIFEGADDDLFDKEEEQRPVNPPVEQRQTPQLQEEDASSS